MTTANPKQQDRNTRADGLLILAPGDNVGIAAVTLEPGRTCRAGDVEITTAERIPLGHKVAIRPIAAGDKILKYGSPIGSATQAIAPGQHVHTHNLESDYMKIVTYSTHDPHAENA